MVLALIQVVRLGGDSLVVVSAAREAARAAAVTTDDAAVRRAAAELGLPSERTEIVVDRGEGVGAPVTVSVTFRAPAAPPLLSWVLPAEVTLRARATMRQEVG